MTKQEFITKVQNEVGFEDYDIAEKATTIVLNALSERLLPNESQDVSAQLPQGIKDLWSDEAWAMKYVGSLNEGKPAYNSKKELFVTVENELNDNEIIAESETLVRCVIHCLKDQVSEGEISDVLGQMPGDVKELFAV